VFEYLIAHADASAQQLLPEAMRDVANESTGRAALLETLEAYLDSDLSIPATASRLSVHTNTVRYRLEKLEKLTGLDVRNFWDLVELGSSLRILSRQAPDGSRAL
jgi:purine catabolism regulator